MKMTDSVNINAPIEEVFYYIADPEKQKLWMDGLVNTEYTDEWNEDNPVGAQFKQRLIKGRKKLGTSLRGRFWPIRNQSSTG